MAEGQHPSPLPPAHKTHLTHTPFIPIAANVETSQAFGFLL